MRFKNEIIKDSSATFNGFCSAMQRLCGSIKIDLFDIHINLNNFSLLNGFGWPFNLLIFSTNIDLVDIQINQNII
jgi:hypothetical protein